MNKKNKVEKMLEAKDCYTRAEVENWTNRVVALDPEILSEEYRTARNQLFFVTGGFGATVHSMGTKVYGYFISDGEGCFFRRHEILGAVRDVPEWARQKLPSADNPSTKTTKGQNI